MSLQINRSLDVSIGYAQFITAKLLQMSGLCVNKQFVQGWDLDVSDQAEIDSHPDLAQVMHGLFAAYLLCRAQNAQRSTDVVMQVLFAFLG